MDDMRPTTHSSYLSVLRSAVAARRHYRGSRHQVDVAVPLRTTKRRSRGQSLTEFALVLPVFLLVVLIGLDFGRAFLAWVEVNNAVREAANFAALNPDAWNAGNPNAGEQAQYQTLITNEWANIDCTVPSPAPDPDFPGGNAIGAPAKVTISCQFHLITPIISAVLGNAIAVSGTAAFPIRSGAIAGIPVQTGPVPTPTQAPSPTPTPAPTPTPSPTPVPTPTPTPMCTVPNLVNASLNGANSAQSKWTGAGFTTANLLYSPLYSHGNGTVKTQSLAPNQSLPCGSTIITVTWQ